MTGSDKMIRFKSISQPGFQLESDLNLTVQTLGGGVGGGDVRHSFEADRDRLKQ